MIDKKLIQEKMIAKWREEIRDNGVDERMDSFYYRCEAFMLSWSDKIAEEARMQEREKVIQDISQCEFNLSPSNITRFFKLDPHEIKEGLRKLTDQKENKDL